MIVVTTPTGDIGHQVVQNLLQSSAQIRVIARDPSHLAEEVRDNVEIVTGSHGDAGVVNEAFSGADTVFWLAPADPKATSVTEAYVDFTRPAAAALKDQGVKRVVSITALGRGSPVADKAGFVTGSLAMDDLIVSMGVAFRGLAMPSFMDNIARQAITIRNQGKFFLPIAADLKLPSVATRDIAAVAARWLLDDSWTGQSEVPVLGPEDISFDDMAAIISEVLGKAVTYQQISLNAYKARFVQFGMSDAMAQGMTDMAWAKDQGLDLAVSRTPENSTPTSFRQWCEDTLKPAVLD
ncbi:NAD-dependent epimerase/dehydratase family protein [Phyllobacterium salinisoli]|uniref:NAD-dependent epimerase/dehydratase family protein n=1 Tax=Phyllobacterium salinisoli TaxID=1899321 RepID=A0A368K3N8_9HYPH|nr:NAD(P)H-binding protein [Phyllobacterium salinisoli]RCS23804.1 NAD-dependent epimerase/dehydratase family protein [Phyllobacterium salinisoli]